MSVPLRPALLALAMLGPVVAAPAKVDFVREIRPLLARHCYDCHGPEEAKGGLRLDQAAAAPAVPRATRRDGRPPVRIVPRRPATVVHHALHSHRLPGLQWLRRYSRRPVDWR